MYRLHPVAASRPDTKQLLLLGGGHSHVEVVRQMGLAPPSGTRIVLVSPERHTPYSGMVPGLVSGHYAFDDCHIDLERLCRHAGVHFVRTAASALDTRGQSVMLDNGTSLPYDVLSIDIGSTPPVGGIPGAPDHATPVKPMAGFLHAWSDMLGKATRTARGPRLAVIGGGAGGVELALALHYRLARACLAAPARIQVVTDGTGILSGHARRAVAIAARILGERAIEVRANSKVVRIEPGRLHVAGGPVIDADHVFLANGAAAPAWIAESGIRTDAHGFISVNAFLQSVSHAGIFAAGDIASVAGGRLPKSGVYAVRQGPPLAANLRRALGGEQLVRFAAQRATLSLISTGNKYAVASYGMIAFAGAWVWHWKDRIDRRFMHRYHAASPADDSKHSRA